MNRRQAKKMKHRQTRIRLGASPQEYKKIRVTSRWLSCEMLAMIRKESIRTPESVKDAMLRKLMQYYRPAQVSVLQDPLTPTLIHFMVKPDGLEFPV